MLIRLGCDLAFQVPSRTAMLLMLYVHPSQAPSLLESDQVQVEPYTPVEEFTDAFGHRCGRLVVSPGKLRLWNTTLIEDGAADRQAEHVEARTTGKRTSSIPARFTRD